MEEVKSKVQLECDTLNEKSGWENVSFSVGICSECGDEYPVGFDFKTGSFLNTLVEFCDQCGWEKLNPNYMEQFR